ncbi:hypothetical protein MIMGU_mgv1a018713mg [Erythranthe guttata]|uniref:Bidirectional sugar transporter SWEET n=1 Tax=Erythranthe guttata TaxID=4155 RepID=A0A022Q1Z7_ERYGU|nr:hypothetical protein MIMGU_mgv1a018713mg [Erythranthe guttata]
MSGILLYLSPMIVEERSSEKLSVTPYILAYLNCELCILYVWILVIKFACRTCECYKQCQNEIFEKRIGALCVVSVVVLTSTFVPFSMPENLTAISTGALATAFSIVLYTLSLVSVIKTKDVEFMSFYSSELMFLNGAFWFAFAVLRKDHLMIISNGFCCAVGAIQTYLMYPNNKGKIENQNEEERIIDSSDSIVLILREHEFFDGFLARTTLV